MNLLIDTHILLWWLDDSSRLPPKAATAIADLGNLLFVSAAVIWEIRIKQVIGKLTIAPTFYRVIQQEGFETLPISADHAYAVGELPLIHRDPFDRLLIAQARIERLTIVTHDPVFKRYDVPLLEP